MSATSTLSNMIEYTAENSTDKRSPIVTDFNSTKQLRPTNGEKLSTKVTYVFETTFEAEDNFVKILDQYPYRKFWFERDFSSSENFISLQRWEGHVIKITKDTFWARLFDLSHPGITEEGEFSLNEIDKPDEDLLAIGSIFTWNIGYLDRPSGRIRTSIIRFRRLPAWNKNDLDKSNAVATELKALFKHGSEL